MIAILGKIVIALLILVAVLLTVGLVWVLVKSKKEKISVRQMIAEEDALSGKTVENVADLNDRFNRARYMNENGN